MSEQAKVSFTKGPEGNTYISKEVDSYLETLHSSHEEMEQELKEKARAVEAFYEGKLTELEAVIGSMKGGIDAVQKENEFLDEDKMKVLEGKKQRRASIISDIIFYGTLVVIVIFAILFSRGAMGMGHETIGGFKVYEVLTTSMESVYPRGSLIAVKQTAPSELVVGDDIAFVAKGNNLVTHRIIEIIENHEVSGKRAFITKGVDNAVADEEVVLAENVVGKVIKGIPRLGAMVRWSGENLWVIVLLVLSLMAFSFFLKMFWRNSKKIKAQDEIEEKRLMGSKRIKATASKSKRKAIKGKIKDFGK